MTDRDTWAASTAVEWVPLGCREGSYKLRRPWLERGVHPAPGKLGFCREHAGADVQVVPCTCEQLIELAKAWNRDGKFGPDALREVEVSEVIDRIATAKVTGAWGIDYLHLAKFEDKWMIAQVLWQSHLLEQPACEAPREQ